jgi:hypothetical protein
VTGRYRIATILDIEIGTASLASNFTRQDAIDFEYVIARIRATAGSSSPEMKLDFGAPAPLSAHIGLD